MSESTDVNRRDFGRHVAAGAALAAALECGSAGVVAAADSDAQGIPDSASPVELLVALIRRQFPDARLNAETLVEVRLDLEQQLLRSRKLSEFPLSNGDAPFVVQTFRQDSDA